MHAMRTTLIIGLALAGPAAGWVAAQESVALMRLNQEVDSLSARLDFENRQLRQRIERLEEALRRLDNPAIRPPEVRPDRTLPPPLTDTHATAELTARRFVVEDAEGRIRAVLGDSTRYGPMLALLDESGELRVLVAQGGTGRSGVEIFDAEGAARIQLVLEDGEPALRLYDAQGQELEIAPEDPAGAER